MSNTHKNKIPNQTEFYEAKFSDLNCAASEIQGKAFENCQFMNSNFSESKFIDCKFVDCEFKSSNLSVVQFNNCFFSEVVFDECKIIGINWTKLKWPTIKLTSSLYFYRSDVSDSSFYGLDLTGIIIEECKAHNVDLRAGDFSNASFIQTDFDGSLFMNSKLHSADFTDAINYNIDPNHNDIRKAKFTMPDVVNLLHRFDIEINGM